jgi:hypothetical protein
MITGLFRWRSGQTAQMIPEILHIFEFAVALDTNEFVCLFANSHKPVAHSSS